MKKSITIILILIGLLVLLGQIWPEGVPPFARVVNIVYLVSSILFLIFSLQKTK